MTRCIHPRSDSDGTGEGGSDRLSTQRDLWWREDRDGLTRSTRGPVPPPPRHAVTGSSLTWPPGLLTTRHCVAARWLRQPRPSVQSPGFGVNGTVGVLFIVGPH